MFKTLKTLVLKTATVTGVKLGTPADRIGQGLGVATAYPTDNLSPGHVPMPHNPEPEPVRSREELSAMQMRKQMQAQADGDAVPPASSAGCPSAPGLSAGRSRSSNAFPFRGWRSTTWTAAAGSTRAVRLLAVPSRADIPGDLRHDDRLGDCQSPRRPCGKDEVATRKVCSAAEAGK